MRTSEAEAVTVLRIHHSLGDGVSLMSLLLACTRKTSQAYSLPSLPGSQRRKSADSTGSSSVWGLLLWLWAILVLTWNTLVDVVNFTATSAFLKDTETPIKGVEGVEFHQKRIVHRTLSLDDIKTVKSAVGGYCKSKVYTVNCGMAYGQAAMLLSPGAKGFWALQLNASSMLFWFVRLN